MKIIKRNSNIVDFDTDKISEAICKAMDETELGVDLPLALKIANNIYQKYQIKQITPSVETIQDDVEEMLASNNRFDVSKRYILYREERSKLRGQAWKMTDLQKDIYEQKYRYNGEVFNEFLNRVSGKNQFINKAIRDKKFLPAGRILAGRGMDINGRSVTLSNCYVLPKVEDNIESIFDTAKHLARTFSYGGGVGFNLSKLRPRNAKVNNSAKSTTGSVSFMDLYSLVTGLIGQNSRRGALIINMDVNHPDIMEFIDVKKDLSKVTSANISVNMTHEFMDAVKSDSDFELYFKVESTGEEIRKTIRARDLFHKLAESNFEMAEPGILFWDNIENNHLMSEDEDFKFAGVNPCQPKGEFILTKTGFKKIEDVIDNVYLQGKEYKSTKMFPTGNKEVFEVELENGAIVKMTGNHPVSIPSGQDVPLEKLVIGDRVMVDYSPLHDTSIENIEEYEKGIMMGYFIADGGFQGNDKSIPDIGFSIGVNEFGLKDFLEELVQKYIWEGFNFKPHSQKPTTCMTGRVHKDELITNFMTEFGIKDYDKFSLDIYNKSKDFKLGFLRAIFTCDGSSRSDGIACLYSVNKDFTRDIQRLLIEFGIYTTITIHNYAKSYIGKDGKVRNNKDCWKIMSYDVDFEKIGYLTHYKNESLRERLLKGRSKRIEGKKKSMKIKSITSIGNMDVYDITVDEVNHYNTNGLVVHNCGEEPLPEFGSCNLSAINLSEFVINPFTEHARFDMDSFNEMVRNGVIYLNEILDYNMDNHPLKEQTEVSRDLREIGLGIMGLADMFIKLGIKYGSYESIMLSRVIGHSMINSALQQSALLAKEHGTFPKYNQDAILKSPFLHSVANDYTIDMISKHGLRNSQLLTIAPTGSTSTMLGVSGGLEPIFQISYNRKTETLNGQDTFYKVFTPIAKEYMEVNNITNEDDLPDYFITSQEIPYKNRIEVQSAWQQYIDASISSTVNLPNDTTVETIEDLYMYAHDMGLKGITVYRDGCSRGGILTTEKSNQDIIDELQSEMDKVIIEALKENPDKCPMCGGEMFHSGGCSECTDCAYSPCSI